MVFVKRQKDTFEKRRFLCFSHMSWCYGTNYSIAKSNAYFEYVDLKILEKFLGDPKIISSSGILLFSCRQRHLLNYSKFKCHF